VAAGRLSEPHNIIIIIIIIIICAFFSEFRRQGIAQKKAYNIQKTAKV